MKLTTRKFYAKLLLFGEYTVTQGGSALALPLHEFSGNWQFHNYSDEYAGKLFQFAHYVSKQLFPGFSANQLKVVEEQINSGMQFVSNVPSGYGLGSSGTFVAAFYDRFFQQSGELSLPELKSVLACMESYFHGKSSGIDPLVSYLDKAILVHGSEIRITELNHEQSPPFRLFLLDTLMERSTSLWVEKFYDKLNKDADFVKAVQRLEKINDETVQAFIKYDFRTVITNFHTISKIQYQAFNEFIPESFRDVWKKGLESGVYNLKLCGAGGGGMLLGITEDQESAYRYFNDKTIIYI